MVLGKICLGHVFNACLNAISYCQHPSSSECATLNLKVLLWELAVEAVFQAVECSFVSLHAHSNI